MKKNICLIIQSRLNSTRIPKKMIKKFGNSNLLEILLKKLNDSNIIDKNNIYISAYEEELKEICRKYNYNIFSRSEESANTDNNMKLMFEWYNKLHYDYYIIISACNPFLELKTIENFYMNFIKINNKASFGVVKKKNYYWNNNNEMITNWPLGQTTFNTKEVENTYEAAHCLYAGKMEDIGKNIYMGDFSKNEIDLFIIENEFECLDIDYPWQFDMLNSYYNFLFK